MQPDRIGCHAGERALHVGGVHHLRQEDWVVSHLAHETLYTGAL